MLFFDSVKAAPHCCCAAVKLPAVTRLKHNNSRVFFPKQLTKKKRELGWCKLVFLRMSVLFEVPVGHWDFGAMPRGNAVVLLGQRLVRLHQVHDQFYDGQQTCHQSNLCSYLWEQTVPTILHDNTVIQIGRFRDPTEAVGCGESDRLLGSVAQRLLDPICVMEFERWSNRSNGHDDSPAENVRLANIHFDITDQKEERNVARKFRDKGHDKEPRERLARS